MASSRLKIKDDLVSALQGIDGGQGYNHEVKLVSEKRSPLEKMRHDQFPAIFLVYGPPETSEFSTADAGYIDSVINYQIIAVLRIERGQNEVDEGENFIEDIKKALYTDIFRGNNADQTLVKTVDLDTITEAPYVICTIGVEVRYQHERSVP